MIPRYSNAGVAAVFTDEAKVARWDTVELAVIQARVQLGIVDPASYDLIKMSLIANPTDIGKWHGLDAVLGHDLNAYLDERREHIPVHLQHLMHQDMTSYDTEEPASALALIECSGFVEDAFRELMHVMRGQARRYQYLPFMERTHGQGAKLRSFGGRFINWMTELEEAHPGFTEAVEATKSSRISGAIGNYGGELSHEIEIEALRILGLEPIIGTQIVTRVIQARLAQSLGLLAEALAKIALDIRLGARSGTPIYQEPFGKKQKGSSAMPHKKNTIRTEQMEGLLRMVRGRVAAITASVQTWEARSIEQSSVERVDWPDLFHLILRMFEQTRNVLGKLAVYPDNMMREIRDARGTYASDEAKGFLAKQLAKRDMQAEDAYRIIQLASFCVFKPKGEWLQLRHTLPRDHAYADELLQLAESIPSERYEHIRDFIVSGSLFAVEDLDHDHETVVRWNAILRDIFSDHDVLAAWQECFSISYLLRSEASLYDRMCLSE